jgi:hypothetical protein
MSLVSCPACNRQLSTAAVACPACGHPMQAVGQPGAGQPYSNQRPGDSKNWTKIAGIAGATWAVPEVARVVAGAVVGLGALAVFAVMVISSR